MGKSFRCWWKAIELSGLNYKNKKDLKEAKQFLVQVVESEQPQASTSENSTNRKEVINEAKRKNNLKNQAKSLFKNTLFIGPEGDKKKKNLNKYIEGKLCPSFCDKCADCIDIHKILDKSSNLTSSFNSSKSGSGPGRRNI